MLTYLGGKLGVILGQNFASMVHPDDRDFITQEMCSVGSNIGGGFARYESLRSDVTMSDNAELN